MANFKGVLLVGSGEVVHNVPNMGARASPQQPWCRSFEDWLERVAGVATQTTAVHTAATTTTTLRQLPTCVVVVQRDRV